jgi:FtsH-binding integral membrane protein
MCAHLIRDRDGDVADPLVALVAVWAAALVVFTGGLAIAASRGPLEVHPAFYQVAASMLFGLLLALAFEYRRTDECDQASIALSVFFLLATASVVALVAVAAPPAEASVVVSAIFAGIVVGLVGVLLIGFRRRRSARVGKRTTGEDRR